MPGKPDHETKAGECFDLIVLGGGGVGLAAALFGAIAGLRPLVVEHTPFIGGTTAWSAGSLWVPGTAPGRKRNPRDTRELALKYLQACTGRNKSDAMLQRFLDIGPKAIATLEDSSEVHLRAFEMHPDYHSEFEGATLCGRALEALPFDGRRLGSHINMIRSPIVEFTVLGGMMVDRTDIGHLLRMTKSWPSLRHCMRLMTRHAADRIGGRRSSRLVMGSALIGRLLASLLARSVPIWRETEVLSLDRVGDRVTGVVVKRDGQNMHVRATAGVVLAGGGFAGHSGFRKSLLPEVDCFSPMAPTSSGWLMELALANGARLGDAGLGHAFWAPVSTRLRRDGSRAVFPHFMIDRAKPGTLVVNRQGRRFLNESTSYNLFAKAMIAANDVEPSIPAFLIADHRALTKFGLGMIRPGKWGLRRAQRDGYVVSAATIEALAEKLDIDPANLILTVNRMNAFSISGIDEDFGRGATAYQRNLGDAAVLPNPTLGPVDDPPFHAIRLYPGEIATSTGLLTDESTRVLSDVGPIPGLFAVGNDMQSIMDGAYPGPGITLGPGITFAYVAAMTAAQSNQDM